jgi:hypothetical protein
MTDEKKPTTAEQTPPVPAESEGAAKGLQDAPGSQSILEQPAVFQLHQQMEGLTRLAEPLIPPPVTSLIAQTADIKRLGEPLFPAFPKPLVEHAALGAAAEAAFPRSPEMSAAIAASRLKAGLPNMDPDLSAAIDASRIRHGLPTIQPELSAATAALGLQAAAMSPPDTFAAMEALTRSTALGREPNLSAFAERASAAAASAPSTVTLRDDVLRSISRAVVAPRDEEARLLLAEAVLHLRALRRAADPNAGSDEEFVAAARALIAHPKE